MKCDDDGCVEMAMTSVRVDPFGKSDAMRNFCSKHAPPWSAISWGNQPQDKLSVACKGGCGRIFKAHWDKGIQCRIVSLTCVCGHVTPVDGGAEHE